MFKKKGSEVKTSSDMTGGRMVVTETVETKTTADGQVVTTTKRVTKVEGDGMESSFGKLDFGDSVRLSGQSTVKKVMYTSGGDELKNGHDEDKKKPPTKSLTERLDLKAKSKDSKVEVNNTSKCESKADIAKFEQDGLKSHNSYRAKHGVSPLKLSKQLCAYSKEWANHLVATDTFQHRTERKYGENIYTKWSSDPSHTVLGNDAVDSWYSEIKDYTFGREPTTLKSGHFTQVMWKESKELGIAMARGSNGRVYVVANYDPPGNFVGTFTENVPAPKK